MELKVGYEIIDSYKRLSYKVWFAFAEFVDNSTQSYRNNQRILDEVFRSEATSLNVQINYQNNPDGYIEISDNSIGMNSEELQKALTIGRKPEIQSGRSKYGLGLKTAAFWFGNHWEIVTTKLGEDKEYHVTVDLQTLIEKEKRKEQVYNIADRDMTPEELRILSTANELDVSERTVGLNEHYFRLRITNLNRTIQPRTASKTREYLRSMYRYDIKENTLILQFQGDVLRWNDQELFGRMLTDDNGNRFYKEFIIDVNGKRVTGWAGILERGSRKDAGFSLLQSKRVIQGWPDSYRPPLLFGGQEGGSNTLVNQRLFGEIFLDGFEVSHTKDEILFTDDDEEVLDRELSQTLADYKRAASEYRKPEIENEEEVMDFKGMVTNLFRGMQEPRFSAPVNEAEVLPQEVIIISNEEYFLRTAAAELSDTYTAQIAGIKVTVYINTEASVYDPYLLVRFRATRDDLGIVINRRHPHWSTMETSETIFTFIKHCIYDGIAEWKANWRVGTLDPETIKMIKDSLLRHQLTFS